MTFLYGAEFHSKRHKHRDWQIGVGRALCELFHITSVVDFGCAIGSFLEGFQQVGAMVHGYELGFEYSSEHTPETVLPFIEFGDVTKPINAPVSDCSWSIEVAEHIPEEGSDLYVENLCRASIRLVVVSAAPPGQGGVGHINCQPRGFWLDKFKSHGFVFDEEKTKSGCECVSNVKGCAKWVQQNLMVLSYEAVH